MGVLQLLGGSHLVFSTSLNMISLYSPVSGVNYARSIVLDPRTGHMYWCQYSDSNLDGGIFSASMDGTNVVEINKSVSTPFGCDIGGL